MKRLIAIAALFTLAACKGDEATAENVSQRTGAIVSDVIGQTARAVEQFSEDETLAAFERAFQAADSAFANNPFLLAIESPTPEYSGEAPAPDPSAPPPDASYEGDAYAEEGGGGFDSPEQADESAAQFSEILRTRIFIEDNIESQDGNEAVFFIHGAPLCNGDPACIQGFEQAQLRIRAKLLGEDGVELAFMIGPDRLMPLVLSLAPRDVAAEIDLGEAKATVQYIAQLSGEEEVELPQVLTGKIRLSLSLPHDQAINARVDILEDIHVRATDDGEIIELHLASASPLASALVDGLAQEIVAELSAGAFSFLGPYWPEGAEPGLDVSPGQMSIAGAGASYTVSLSADDPSLRITNISLGVDLGELAHAFEVRLDQNLLFGADLNAHSGRVAALTITPDAVSNSAAFTFAPELDLELGFFLQHIAAYEAVESFFMDETYRVHLSGAGEVSVLPIAATDSFPGGLKVTSGQLEISSSAASSSVVVHEGECLVGLDGAAPDAHPVLGALAVVSCQ